MGSSELFIELKYKEDGKGIEGINFIENNKVETGKYMLCGGILNKKGGKVLFKARSMEEANEFAKHNPLSNRMTLCS